MMHYDQFSKANLTRCEAIDGFNHKLNAWSISDWLVAFVGEFGEMCNVQKKLNRVHSGIRGNKEPTSDLVTKRRRELGDAGVYLDLIAQRMGFNLLDAMIEVFNLKSEELGYPVRLPEDYMTLASHNDLTAIKTMKGEIDQGLKQPVSDIDKMDLQAREFATLEHLIEAYQVLPDVGDNMYYERRRNYEVMLKIFLEAAKANGRT